MKITIFASLISDAFCCLLSLVLTSTGLHGVTSQNVVIRHGHGYEQFISNMYILQYHIFNVSVKKYILYLMINTVTALTI
jgi:hypothetical protein